ncbi:MAG: hypothetical protein KGZ30_02595 [Anaplasmataceae bacterium]|nr:hypothetical protein [Anaplasmataceae bacterium]
MNKFIKVVGGGILILGSSITLAPFYVQAQPTQGWVLNGSNVVTDLNTQNVGVGLQSPGKKLDVAGSLRIDGHLISNASNGAFVFNAGPAVPGRLNGFFFRRNATLGQEGTVPGTYFELVRITADGDVGIGTLNPVSKLDLNGAMHFSALGVRPPLLEGTIYYDSGAGNFQCAERIGGSVTWVPCGGGGGAGGGLFTPVGQQTVGFLPKYSSSSNQLVPGIVSDNGSKLIVGGDVEAGGVFRKGSAAGISPNCSGGQVLVNPVVSGGIITGGTCGTVGAGGSGGGWVVSGSAVVTQSSTPRVGIGLVSPGKELDINGSVRFSGGHLITNASNGAFVLNAGPGVASGFFFRRATTLGSEVGAVDLVRIDGNSGNVGLGTNSPGAKLELFTNTANALRFRTDNPVPGSVDLFAVTGQSFGPGSGSGDSLCLAKSNNAVCLASWAPNGSSLGCGGGTAVRALCAVGGN